MDDVEGLGPDSNRRRKKSCVTMAIKKRNPTEIVLENEAVVGEDKEVEDTRV